jgi:hypothetical protein
LNCQGHLASIIEPFIPLAFRWMVHVYPFNGDDLKVVYRIDVPKPPTD